MSIEHFNSNKIKNLNASNIYQAYVTPFCGLTWSAWYHTDKASEAKNLLLKN